MLRILSEEIWHQRHPMVDYPMVPRVDAKTLQGVTFISFQEEVVAREIKERSDKSVVSFRQVLPSSLQLTFEFFFHVEGKWPQILPIFKTLQLGFQLDFLMEPQCNQR